MIRKPEKKFTLAERLAVCTWSLQPNSPQDLITKLAATGIRRVQLALDPLRESPKIWGETENLFRANGITVVSGMVGCLGEDYSTLDSIRLTGGIAPDATWEQNLKNIRACAALAKKMGLKLVTFHAGFLPPDDSHPTFAKMLQRLDEVADIFMVQNILLGLETGQETAPELADLLHKLNHPNIGVNFDPANMIMYDKGDPVKALHILAPWIRQVHIKDAKRTKVPGTWGEEVPVGKGEVDWRAFFSTFKHVIFNVNLAIEREYGTSRVADIRTAREVVEKTFF
jgi:sugar phosphate isomerase/epimerase